MTDKKCQNLEAVRYDQSARDMRQLKSKVMQFLSRQAFPLRGMTESELVTKTSGGRALNSCTTSELSADAFLLAFHQFGGIAILVIRQHNNIQVCARILHRLQEPKKLSITWQTMV